MKRRSWKTTAFGFLGGSGAAILAATRTGFIDGSKLPDWVNVYAGLASVIGTFGLGFFARDNDVSSEESGAKAKQTEVETSFITKHPGAVIPHAPVPPSEVPVAAPSAKVEFVPSPPDSTKLTP
jgi:hypothetical protein